MGTLIYLSDRRQQEAAARECATYLGTSTAVLSALARHEAKKSTRLSITAFGYGAVQRLHGVAVNFEYVSFSEIPWC